VSSRLFILSLLLFIMCLNFGFGNVLCVEIEFSCDILSNSFHLSSWCSITCDQVISLEFGYLFLSSLFKNGFFQLARNRYLEVGDSQNIHYILDLPVISL